MGLDLNGLVCEFTERLGMCKILPSSVDVGDCGFGASGGFGCLGGLVFGSGGRKGRGGGLALSGFGAGFGLAGLGLAWGWTA